VIHFFEFQPDDKGMIGGLPTASAPLNEEGLHITSLGAFSIAEQAAQPRDQFTVRSLAVTLFRVSVFCRSVEIN